VAFLVDDLSGGRRSFSSRRGISSGITVARTASSVLPAISNARSTRKRESEIDSGFSGIYCSGFKFTNSGLCEMILSIVIQVLLKNKPLVQVDSHDAILSLFHSDFPTNDKLYLDVLAIRSACVDSSHSDEAFSLVRIAFFLSFTIVVFPSMSPFEFSFF
jgi:hypothetical protein